MTKTISSVITSALNLNNNNPLPDQIEQFFAVEMFFDSGTVRLWSGIGTKTINNNSHWDKCWTRIADHSVSSLSNFVSGGNKINFHKVFQNFSFIEKTGN